MFIKKEIAGSSLSAFSLCDLLWSCLRARKNLDYPFCVWNGGWKLFSSRVCSTLPSPWPMIIYFQLTDHTAFASFFWKTFSHLLQLINWITCPSLFGFLFLTSRLKSLLGPHFCQLCLFFWYCYDWCTPRFLPPGLGVFVLSKNTAESVVAYLPAHFNCSKDESVMSRVKVNEMHPPWKTTCSQILRTYL